MHCTCCVEVSHFVNVAKLACDQCSIFSTVQYFVPDYGVLLKLHALTQITRSYALLRNLYMLLQDPFLLRTNVIIISKFRKLVIFICLCFP